MKLTIFSKQKTSKETGKNYYIFLSTLTRKDGTEVTVRVHFRNECGNPDPHTCPRVIEVDKKNANIAIEKYTTTEGEQRESKHLWVTAWKDCGEFVDTSLDDFE